ncbi:AMP-binding protein [Nocardia vaccinii]|uniref:AMP-binding protein n=1 Tax=Nocardia vaccinii TaxID=1822 RepID=UPI000834895B|nr:AMP-binding protein [Nocardia vaccinii]
MPTRTAPHADHPHIVPVPRAVPEVDPNAVVRSGGGCDLTVGELDSWSNRLARLLLQDGAGPGTRIVIAIDAPIEELVAERAVTKIGGIAVHDSQLPACGTHRGITTRQSRRRTDSIIEWLVLDDRTTLRRYLSGSDAPLGTTDHPVLRRTA